MKPSAVDVLKEAFLLEMRGKALYQSSVRDDMPNELKELFAFFAKEEDGHANLIKERLMKVNASQESYLQPPNSAFIQPGISLEKIVSAVHAAGYEAAIVAAALDFESRAFEYYQKQADQTNDAGLKKLFGWLADWEKQHMVLFAKLDQDIREKVWYDNQFWPLD